MAKTPVPHEKKKTGRPPKPMPEPIPDTPENITRAFVNTPPKKEGDWDYLKEESLEPRPGPR